MKYFDLLNTHSDNSLIKEQIDDFENRHKYQLPSFYKCLISIFDLSNIASEKLLCYYSPKSDIELQLYDVKYKVPNISIDKWYSLDKIINNMKTLYKECDEDLIEGYLAIGESFNQGVILLGVSNTNRDEIFIEHLHSKPRIRKVDSNIFCFLNNFEVTPMADFLPDGIKLKHLYKKWGENSWRIQGTDKTPNQNL